MVIQGPRGGQIIRRARQRSGLTQTELASRLSTSRSELEDWERGTLEPPFETVLRAVRACGLDLSLGIYTYDDQHDALIDMNLRVSPEQRLKRMVQARESVESMVARARFKK